MCTENLELIYDMIMAFGLVLAFIQPGLGLSTVIMLTGLVLYGINCG